MPTLRFHLLLGTSLLAAAACAHQPERADHDAGATSSPGAVSTTAPTPSTSTAAASIHAMQSSVPPRLLLFARDEGYRQVAIKGRTYYFCKTEDPMGSIIPLRQCINQSQLEFLRQQMEQQRQQLVKPIGNTIKSPP